MIPLIPIAISLAAKFIPSLIGKLAGKGAEKVAETVVSIGQGITGESNPGNILDALTANSAKAAEFQARMNELTITLAQEDTKRLEAVNATMQAESRSNSLMQRAWRPFNGFLFGITIWCDYFLGPILLQAFKSDITLTHVPTTIYLLWSTVLGATAWTRGKEKMAQAGNTSPGILDILKNVI